MKFNIKLSFICALLCILSNQLFAQFGSSFGEQQRAADRARMANLLAYRKAIDEGRNVAKWWKAETSIGIAMAGATNYSQRSKYDSMEHIYAPSHDTTIKGRAQSQIGFYVNMTSDHMLARLGMNSILSLSVGAQINFLRWQYEPFNGNQLKTVSSDLVFAQVGIPITLDYKWGCDVDFAPEMKTCYAIGAGAMPLAAMSMSNLSDAASSYRISPYIYASFGVYAWGCWKVRVSYMPGSFDVFNDMKTEFGQTVNTLNVKGQHIFTIGIGHMEHSIDWGNGNGWRESGMGGGSRFHKHTGGYRRMF